VLPTTGHLVDELVEWLPFLDLLTHLVRVRVRLLFLDLLTHLLGLEPSYVNRNAG